MKALRTLLLAVGLLLAGCAEDSTPSSPLPAGEATQFAGYWEFDLTATSKSGCGAPEGTRERVSVVLGTGAASAYISIFGDLVPLEVDGNRARGNKRVDNTTYLVELDAGVDGLSGHLRLTRSIQGSTAQCIRDYRLEATRNAAPPALEEISDWDLLISMRETTCSGIDPGLFEECLSLRRDGFAVSMQWPAGELAGTATDDRVVLMQIVENSAIRIDIDMDGDELTGELQMMDMAEGCSMRSDVVAERVMEPCPASGFGKLPWFLEEARATFGTPAP